MKNSLPRFTVLCLIGLPLAFPLGARAADSDPVVIRPAPETGDAAAQEELAQTRAENRRLANELDLARRTIGRLNTELGALRGKDAENAALNDLQTKLASTQSALELLTTKNQQLESNYGAALLRAKESEHREAELRDQLAAAKAAPPAAPDLSGKLADTEAKLATTLRSFSQLQAENEKLKTTAADATRLSSELQQANDAKASAEAKLATALAQPSPDLTVKLSEAEDKLAATLRSFSQLQAENDRLKTDAADVRRLSDELKKLQNEKADLEAKLAATPAPDLTAKLSETEEKLATTLRSFSQLQAENERLKTDAADARRLGDELKKLQDEKAGLEAKLAAAPATPAPDLTAKLAETEDKLATTLRSFSQLESENERLKAAAADTAKQSDELKSLRDEKASLEARLAAQPANAPAPDTSGKLAEAESKLETVLRSYSLLQAENERLKTESANNAANAQATAAKSSSESASQLSALFDELRQTKAQATALAAENAQLKTRLALAGPPPGSLLSSPSRPGASTNLTPTPAAPPANAAPPRQHIVAPGDTLAKISRQYYGTPGRWDEIQRANPDVIKNENNLPIGATLTIP